MTIPNDFLSKRSLEILRILSHSDRPLTIHEIKLKLNKTLDISESEIASLIKSLSHDSGEMNIELFRWDQIPGDSAIESKVFELLIKHIPDLNHINTKNFEFKKNNTNDTLTLWVNGKSILEINRLNDDPSPSEKRNYNFPNHPNLTITSGKTISLLENDEDRILLPTSSFLNRHERFIHSLKLFKSSFYFIKSDYVGEVKDFELDIKNLSDVEKSKDRSEIQVAGYANTPQINILVQKLKDLKGDPNNKQYSLSVSGLLLYILNELEQDKLDGYDINSEINTALKNLSANFVHEFPFLYNFDKFEKLFYTISPNNVNYGLEVLKKISIALINLLDCHIDFLDYWVTRRYHNEIMLYLLEAINVGLLENDKKNASLIQSYSLKILPLLREYLEYESKDILNHFNYINDKNIDNEELARGFGGKFY